MKVRTAVGLLLMVVGLILVTLGISVSHSVPARSLRIGSGTAIAIVGLVLAVNRPIRAKRAS